MTGAISGAVTVAFNESQMFSQEQLLDCLSGDDAYDWGCDGGLTAETLDALVKDNTSCVENTVYPYKQGSCMYSRTKTYVCPQPGNQDGTCLRKSEEGAIVVKSYEKVGTGEIHNTEEIKEALITYGALSIAMYADTIGDYSSGIFNCSGVKTEVDHAVLLTGFGKSEDGIPYWEVKNSWGADWGEEGYIRVQIGSNEGGERVDCGISSEVVAVTSVTKVGKA